MFVAMSPTRFARVAWGVVAWNLLVILWGAYVRASGSGAGCGSHWPLCNGEVIPQSPTTHTLVEFTHRLTSGLALVLVGALVWLARRTFPPGHPARRGAWASLALTLSEALVGAGLVLFELVAKDDSLARAASLGVHLVNTFLLVAVLALTAWWGGGAAPVRLAGRGRAALPWGAALTGLLLVGITGAIAALGDTLFPAGTLAEGLAQDTAPTAHLLLRLRVLHPTLAVAAGVVVLALAAGTMVRLDGTPARLARAAGALVLVQWSAGLLNLLLLAPAWLQLVHLLLADLVWIAAVLLAASVLALPAGRPAPAEPGAAEPLLARR